VALTSDVRPAPHDHVVQFYGHDGELADGVVPYLAEAIGVGGAAVVIATPAHRAAFRDGLARLGIDVAAAESGRGPSGGSLVLLDAGEAADALVVDGSVAAHRFDKVIGDLIHDVAAGGRVVRAYGEIVAELWAAGNITAALELEELWNGLRQDVDFSLYCAYPLTVMEAGGDVLAVHEVCRQHSAVVGAPVSLPRIPGLFGSATPAGRLELARTFPPGRRGVTDARRFVTATLTAWGEGDLVDAAAVIATELAGNAVVHAGTEFTVSLSRSRDGSVRVAVSDASPELPRPRQAVPTDGSGRGLRLVAAFAAGWGAEQQPGGKVVWARLAPSPATAAGAG
jgi:hypothetical protein